MASSVARYEMHIPWQKDNYNMETGKTPVYRRMRAALKRVDRAVTRPTTTGTKVQTRGLVLVELLELRVTEAEPGAAMPVDAVPAFMLTLPLKPLHSRLL